MITEPTVSVVIPAYNGEQFIAQAIESVLYQTYKALEVIVVDDGSSDSTALVAGRFPSVDLIIQSNAGPAEARNTGIRASTGEFIALLDSDDVWRPEKIERQVELFHQDATLDGAFTLVRHFLTEGEGPPLSFRPHLLDTDAVGYTPSTFIVRKKAFARVGWFSSGHLADDADWFFRAKDAGLIFGVVYEPLVLKRVRAASISGAPDRLLRGVVASAHDSILRQRDLVSVLIAAHNGERYLDQALGSVKSQGLPLETIVVDDGSTDRTGDVVARHPDVRYIFQENQGTAAALNRAFAESRGRYVAFLDQDDVWAPGKLTVQLDLLRERQEVDMVQGHLHQFVSPEIPVDQRRLIAGEGRIEPAPLPGTTLVRRSAFERVGPFDTGLTVGYFADWMFRAAEARLQIQMIDDVLLERRLHFRNQSADPEARAEYARAAKAALDRRRGRAV